MEANRFMLKSKRIAIAILGVIANNVTLANDVTLVSRPNHGLWSFAANALYLQPSFGGNGLGYSSFSNYSGNDDNGHFVGVSGTSNRINNLNPKWAWGVELEGAYRFNEKNDVELQWYHLNENVNGYLPPGSVFSGNYDGFYAGFMQLAQNWNAVNLEVGHLVSFDDTKNVRLHAGLSFANIKNKFTNYPQLYPTGSPIFITTDTLSYSGIGPRVGGDFGYVVGHGVSLYAKTAASVLLGSSKQRNSGFQNYTNSIYGFQPYGTPNYNQTNNGVIVTELDAKLEARYDYQMANGILSFDLGYLWMNYLNAITSYTDIGIVGTGDGASIGTNTTANFNLNGLYFGMKWLGNI